MFSNRKLVIATKHSKEKVIAPVLHEQLGVNCFVPLDFDTDLLGTFSGEIDRIDDPLTTIRNKCLQAMALTKCDLGVASEGSFGNHPTVFMAPADDEFLIFIDLKNNLEIVVRELTLDTNFATETCTTYEQVVEFAERVQFPTHALVIKKSQHDVSNLFKGIEHWDQLQTVATHFIETEGQVYLETDMRAMHNPTRMKVIENLAHKLAQKIKSNCPKCQTPGFDITSTEKGLPCVTCGSPTNSVKKIVKTCSACTYTEKLERPDAKKVEDPMYCDYCNP